MNTTSQDAAETLRCGSLFNTAQWQDALARSPVEVVEQRRVHFSAGSGQPVRLSISAVTDSALWRGYEDDAGLRDVMRGPVTYASSLYAVSNPLNRCTPDEAIELLDRAYECAQGWGTPLVATNLEPGLVLERVEMQRPPDAVVRLDATCRAALPSSLDEFMATLGRSARSDLRRRDRRAREQGVWFEELQGAVAHEHVDEFYDVTAATAAKHGNAPLFDRPTLHQLLNVDGARLLTANQAGNILAASLSTIHDGCLNVAAAGVRHETLHTHHPYVFLLSSTLAWAIDHGCDFMDFGRGTFEFKRRHGFHPTDLYSLFYLTGSEDPELVNRLREMNSRITSFLGF